MDRRRVASEHEEYVESPDPFHAPREPDSPARIPEMRFARDGSVLAANDALLNLLGFSRTEFEAGRIDWDELTPRAYWVLDEQFLAQLAQGNVPDPYVKEFFRKDGSRIAVRLVSSPGAAAPAAAIVAVVALVERGTPPGDGP